MSTRIGWMQSVGLGVAALALAGAAEAALILVKSSAFQRRKTMNTKLIKQSLAAIGLASALLSPALAAPITFDLESIALGTYTSASQTVSGVTLTISRVGGSSFEIADITPNAGVPASYLNRTLNPFNFSSGGAFVFSFDTVFRSISVELGDFEPSDIDTSTLTAGTGSDSVTTTNTASGFGPYSLNVNNVGRTCVRTAGASGGSATFPQSVFWDNIRINTCDVGQVPEPTSSALMLLGLAAAGLVSIRQVRAK